MEAFLLVIVLIVPSSSSFCFRHADLIVRKTNYSTILRAEGSSSGITSSEPPELNSEAIKLKDDIIALADKTRRGFTSSRTERKKMNQIVNELTSISPTDEPAASYYENQPIESSSTISGKWTLIYTDAPDITSLEGGPLSENIGYLCLDIV